MYSLWRAQILCHRRPQLMQSVNLETKVHDKGRTLSHENVRFVVHTVVLQLHKSIFPNHPGRWNRLKMITICRLPHYTQDMKMLEYKEMIAHSWLNNLQFLSYSTVHPSTHTLLPFKWLMYCRRCITRVWHIFQGSPQDFWIAPQADILKPRTFFLKPCLLFLRHASMFALGYPDPCVQK